MRSMEVHSQLCLPAGPNSLGFFATEGLTVHPTRSQTDMRQKMNTRTNTEKKQSVRWRLEKGKEPSV